MAVQHYENFPVASLLCPAALRPAIVAIYQFARTADDLADEGDADPAQRIAQLTQYREDLDAALAGRAGSGRWAAVFAPLAEATRAQALPPQWLHALLDAFVQDVRNPLYADRTALLDYCARSANPVGRLLLHLYRVGDALSLRQSDAICSALQLINFWQDLSVDLPRGRVYVPLDALQRHGLELPQLLQREDSPATRAGGARAGRLGRRTDGRGRAAGAAPAGACRLGACGWWCKGASGFLRKSPRWTTPAFVPVRCCAAPTRRACSGAPCA